MPRKLGRIQQHLASRLTDDWADTRSWAGESERVYRTLEKFGVCEINENGHPTLYRYWSVRRGPSWYDYAYQWKRPACEQIDVGKIVAEDERSRKHHMEQLRYDINDLAKQIVDESERLAAGKNDPSDLMELARKRAALKAEYDAIEKLPADTSAVYVAFEGGEVIRVEVKHGWTPVAMKLAAGAYLAKHGGKVPPIIGVERV